MNFVKKYMRNRIFVYNLIYAVYNNFSMYDNKMTRVMFNSYFVNCKVINKNEFRKHIDMSKYLENQNCYILN